jgi:hypothetical protein
MQAACTVYSKRSALWPQTCSRNSSVAVGTEEIHDAHESGYTGFEPSLECYMWVGRLDKRDLQSVRNLLPPSHSQARTARDTSARLSSAATGATALQPEGASVLAERDCAFSVVLGGRLHLLP